MTAVANDARWMRRALALARRAEGMTRPNPPVGAVIVENGAPLGSGWHHAAGQPHAEVNAFAACPRPPSRDATLYVTLEPCCTAGRTPPCTDLIVRSGIRRVVAACPDPNPRHAGRGFEVLSAAGIEVATGVCRAEAEALIEPFATRMLKGRPFFTVKLASTLDGRIADRDGSSQWITGEKARAWVQRMRRRCDAVIVGAGTVAADDPSLLCRLAGAPKNLFRVIVDGRGRIPASARVLNDEAAARTVVATAVELPQKRIREITARGARVWTMPSAEGGGAVDLRALAKRLGDEGLMHVLCEGGGKLAGSLAAAGLADEFALFYAPKVLGDACATPCIAGLDLPLSGALSLEIREMRRIGADLLVMARPAREDAP